MLALNDVTVTHGKATVLSRVSLQIHPGELVCVVGPSASGKSILMALLTKTLSPTEGMIEIDGVDLHLLPPTILQLYRSRLGIILQEDMLSPHRTITENLSLPLELRHASQSSIAQSVTTALQKIHLAHRAFDLPSVLSHGERKLVLIARTLIHSPLILLADEPLADLDTEQAIRAITLLKEYHHLGNTVIVMTTDAHLPEELKARVFELHRGTVKETTQKKTVIEEPKTYDILEEAIGGKRVKISATSS